MSGTFRTPCTSEEVLLIFLFSIWSRRLYQYQTCFSFLPISEYFQNFSRMILMGIETKTFFCMKRTFTLLQPLFLIVFWDESGTTICHVNFCYCATFQRETYVLSVCILYVGVNLELVIYFCWSFLDLHILYNKWLPRGGAQRMITYYLYHWRLK